MAAEIDSGPEIEHHHHETGHRWLDITLGVSAAFVSLMSLFLAIQHGHVMEKMVEASTWPYVMIQFSNSNPDGTPHVTLHVMNKGVGPAKIESVEFFYHGVAQPDGQALLKAIVKPVDPNRHIPYLESDVVDSVLAANENLTIMDLDAQNFTAEETATIRAAMPRLQFRVCYCSVFDECSVLDSRQATRPFAVKACSVPEVPFRG